MIWLLLALTAGLRRVLPARPPARCRNGAAVTL